MFRAYVFFVQAEDGIRDYKVTGVQTCALPIYDKYNPFPEEINRRLITAVADLNFCPTEGNRDNLRREGIARSEERRVGKASRSRKCRDTENKNDKINQNRKS